MFLSHQDIIPFDFDFEAIDFRTGIVFPGSVFDTEPPGVPGAGHRVIFDVAFGQRRSHVGTEIVDRIPLVALAKHRHHATVDRYRATHIVIEF